MQKKSAPEIPLLPLAGTKFARDAFLGRCTLRHGVGAAGRLALEGKLGKHAKPVLDGLQQQSKEL